MNLTTLKNNVFQKAILGFLAIPILAASTCAFVPGYSEIKVFIFAMVVFVWSLKFPKLNGRDLTLPGGAVDFWYYSLALIGVFLFFAANADQRERLRLSETYNAALERSAQLSKDKRLFADVSSKRDALFDEIITMAQRRADRNRKDQLECSAKMGRRQFERSAEPGQRPDQDFTKRLPVEPRIDTEQAHCDAVFKVSGWYELAAAENYEQLSERAANGTPAESTLVVNGVALALPVVANYMVLAPGSEGWTKKMASLNADIEKAERSRTEAASAYRDVGKKIENASVFFGNFTNFLWPYILISALGMKLARKPYAYREVQA